MKKIKNKKSKITKGKITKRKTSKISKCKNLRRNPTKKEKLEVLNKLIDDIPNFNENKFKNKLESEFMIKKYNFQPIFKIQKFENPDYTNELNKLIGEDIILHFIDSDLGGLNSTNNKKIFGILKHGSKNNIYLFQFDPLKQYLYEPKINSPIDLHFYNERDVDTIEAELFEKDSYTYEIEFISDQVIMVMLPKINIKNEYIKGEVTITSTINELIIREIQ